MEVRSRSRSGRYSWLLKKDHDCEVEGGGDVDRAHHHHRDRWRRRPITPSPRDTKSRASQMPAGKWASRQVLGNGYVLIALAIEAPLTPCTLLLRRATACDRGLLWEREVFVGTLRRHVWSSEVRRWVPADGSNSRKPAPLLEMVWPRAGDKAGCNPQVARDIPLV